MDPRHGPVTVTISGTSAQLLTHLATADGQAGDPSALLMRALGLLDLAMKAKREGKHLQFIDPRTGHTSEVVF